MADYTAEVSLGYENLDANFTGEDLYIGGLTYYTSPLSYMGKTPYDEAAFFNRVGQVDLFYGRATGFGDDFNNVGLAYAYRSSEDANGYSASWMHSDLASDVNQYEVGYYRYLAQGFRVGADVSLLDYGNSELWSYGLNSKRLFIFENDRWLSLDGGIGWADNGGDSDWSLNALATYYPNARTGLGIGAATTDRFDDYDTQVSMTRYVRENLALNVSYNRSFIRDNSDGDGISFGGKFRF